ncbi:uncharacterized protein LOC143072436 [Mytilus galloprovincialis]|uniref:NF-kappa-B essential modulator NEMO CC2-LZ domain-containing protein n=1 Tax=Mytilus galloprovincialis TaxID=29158 RepID=A0A8B6EDB2_MYTGA|nr:Hypothetical predicted protein [Mytilus galloprovincialis]
MSQKSSSPESSLMTLSVEQERDSYKEKVEHMKLMIQKYKQEIQAQKIRREGVETVSRLLHESREENAAYQKKNIALETVVRNLQSRLSMNGISDGMTLGEGDVFIPGSSKQVLDNLARENKRLRSLLQGASTDPEEINELQQLIENKNIEIKDLRHTIVGLSEKLQSTGKLMKSSDDEKLSEIKKLQDKISSMKNECETRDILCSSLAEETNTLKQQLHDVAVHCQKLAVKLELSEKSKVHGGISSSQTDVEKLQEENASLKDKLSELVKMNKRWQEYMSQKERYWQQIEQNHVQPDRIQAINAALEDASRRLQKLEREKKQCQEELDERNQQLIEKSSELMRLQNDVECGNLGHDDGHLRSDVETISALKAQIQICTEDFESERKDREKAQNRVAELEAEVSQYKRMRPDDGRLPHQSLFEPRNPSSPESYGGFNLQGQYNRESQLAARGPMRRREENVYDMFNVVDAIQTDSAHTSKQDKTNKEGTNLATKLKVEKPDTDPDNLLDTVPDLNDFNSVDSDTELALEIAMRKVEDINLTHCPRCDHSFELGHDQETREHLEKCCD